MKIAGVVLDSWKLSIFKKHLDGAGYSYTEHPGITKSTLILKVKCKWISELQPIIEAANEECARERQIRH